MKTCVFAGPTLYGDVWPGDIRRYAPAAMGSVFRAVEAGYQRIGIVDGLFGNAPSIWHKEILYAISADAEVVGAASMGALRAAELAAFGMVGIGRIFRLFRGGLWTDDDEVAVLHAGEELDHRPLSETMANVRFTLRGLRREGAVGRETESELVGRMKARHFSERTREAMREDARLLLGSRAGSRLADRFELEYIDVKGPTRRRCSHTCAGRDPRRGPSCGIFPLPPIGASNSIGSSPTCRRCADPRV